jgi:hypothetical protein
MCNALYAIVVYSQQQCRILVPRINKQIGWSWPMTLCFLVGYVVFIFFVAMMPTCTKAYLRSHIASLRQTADFTPGYIAEKACREELLDLAGMMPTQSWAGYMEVTTARALSTTTSSCRWLPAFVYLERAGKQRLWLAVRTWGVVALIWGDVSGGVLERSLQLTETAGIGMRCTGTYGRDLNVYYLKSINVECSFLESWKGRLNPYS